MAFKQTVKQGVYWGFRFAMLPFALLYNVNALLMGKDTSFRTFSQLFSLLPGTLGSYCRIGLYQWLMTHCDKDMVIGFGVLFSQRDTELYQGSYIGPQCNIGSCIIEQNCLLGSGVHILSGKQQHAFENLDVPIREQGGTYTKIFIGHDSWIGNGAIVMANVGHHCIVGAGSVVTSELPDYSVAVGNPAKIIKTRK